MQITLNELSSDWLKMSSDYRPSAFWFWNDELNHNRMREVVNEMAEKGIREFLIHPVHGMEIEYLSDEFFERYRFALQLAKDHGLKVWIYDEFGWPTGNAGGLLLRHHPEHKGWYLAFSKDENGVITAEPQQSNRILDNTMGAPWTKYETGYLDTLSVEAVTCFINMTHERYKVEGGDLFDEVVIGFFTDEPADMMDTFDGCPGGWNTCGLPWTPGFPDRFFEKFEYHIEPLYAQLAGENASAKRDYWTLAKEMHINAYHAQIAVWCQNNGKKYTGHVGEDTPLMQSRFAGSVYQALSLMDEPGIDYLGAGSEPEDRFGAHVLVPSIARHSGRDRVYCEAYGISSLDLRLGPMLKRAEMFGINGINDFALMGFHNSLHGIRKHIYWPPIFNETPWWDFYPEFRDASARSLALTSMGKRKCRYAILYPQNALEQTDPFFTDVFSKQDFVSKTLDDLGLAIYEGGEAFEFVFPEIINEASVRDSRIYFNNADYDAIIAPSDIEYFDNDMSELNRISISGGNILSMQSDDIINIVKSKKPLWEDTLGMQHNGNLGDIRVFRFEYPDGELFVFRNVTGNPVKIDLSSKVKMTEWSHVTGDVVSLQGNLIRNMEPHGTLYISLEDGIEVDIKPPVPVKTLPVDAMWSVRSRCPNTARLSSVRFLHKDHGWLDAVDSSLFGDRAGRTPIGLPKEFRHHTRIEMSAGFECTGLPECIGVLYENQHLESLSINGNMVDLTSAEPFEGWDHSCRSVDISQFVKTGWNEVNSELTYPEYEMSVYNHGFLMNWALPTCDIYLDGSFVLLDGKIKQSACEGYALPLDLSKSGWSEYSGVAELNADVYMDHPVIGIRAVLVEEDCLEVLIDGISIGKRIYGPYEFLADDISPGHHYITLKLTGTSANILGNPAPWGITSLEWLCK
ncbi:MAG: hypothetical protein ACYC27_02310 [Armatimonadota bacterium]